MWRCLPSTHTQNSSAEEWDSAGQTEGQCAFWLILFLSLTHTHSHKRSSHQDCGAMSSHQEEHTQAAAGSYQILDYGFIETFNNLNQLKLNSTGICKMLYSSTLIFSCVTNSDQLFSEYIKRPSTYGHLPNLNHHFFSLSRRCFRPKKNNNLINKHFWHKMPYATILGRRRYANARFYFEKPHMFGCFWG